MRAPLFLLPAVLLACDPGGPRQEAAVAGGREALLSPSPIAPLNSAGPTHQSLSPAGFTSVGSATFFVADGLGAGRELWVTDGTTGGTTLVRDVQPGPAGAAPFALTALGSRLLFVGTEASTGQRVWVSDGTRAGTTLTVDFAGAPPAFAQGSAGGGRGAGAGITVFGGFAYYPATTGLVRTDGTPAGTQVVNGLSWLSDFNASPITVFKGELYGGARGATGGWELYAFNPADGGARLVADVVPGSASSYPYQFTPSGEVLYFVCLNAGFDSYLCATDGATTRVLARMQAVNISSPAAELIAIDGGVLFRGVFGSGAPPPTQLLRADNDGGTGLVAVLNPAGTAWPGAFANAGALTYFLALDNTAGYQVWATDGTGAGTRRLTTGLAFPETPLQGNKQLLTPLGGEVYFCGSSDGLTRSLMVLDATADGGARVVRSLAACDELRAVGGGLLFQGGPADAGVGLWASDGTAQGTRLLFGLPDALHSARASLAAVDGGVVFPGFAGASYQPFFTAGTSAAQLTDAGPEPYNLAAAGGRVYFGTTPNPPQRNSLWVTDGTAAGTRWLADFSVPSLSSITPFQDGVLTEGNGAALWRANQAGAAQVSPLTVTTFLQRPIGVLGSLALVGGTNGSGTSRLWRTDADGGSAEVRSEAGLSLAYPSRFTRVGGELYFSASDRPFGNDQLWRAGGADGGARLASTAVPLNTLAPLGSSLIFSSIDALGAEPWISDGTDAGTRQLVDLVPGAGSSNPSDFANAGSRVFFAACQPLTGCEPWVTDGTPGGTRLLGDLLPGPVGSAPHDFSPVGAGVTFVASDGVNGMELWFSDGTTLGTVPLTDLLPGPGSSNPSQPTLSGGRLFFVADDGTGRTVWSLSTGFADAGSSGGANDAGATDAGGNDAGGNDAGGNDTGANDAGANDAGANDAGANDAGANDAGGVDDAGANDAGANDAGANDAGVNDAGANDAGGNDAGANDAGANDAGANDAGVNDAGTTDGGAADGGAPDAGPGEADGGDLDAGAGEADGGDLDAGAGEADGGELDAGSSGGDGGRLDAGAEDAGQPGDGGTPDAGLGQVTGSGCGCQAGGAEGLVPLVLLGLLALPRRRRAPHPR